MTHLCRPASFGVQAGDRGLLLCRDYANNHDTENADINAAKNIIRRADSSLKPVEEHRIRRPNEAGSTRRAA